MAWSQLRGEMPTNATLVVSVLALERDVDEWTQAPRLRRDCAEMNRPEMKHRDETPRSRRDRAEITPKSPRDHPEITPRPPSPSLRLALRLSPSSAMAARPRAQPHPASQGRRPTVPRASTRVRSSCLYTSAFTRTPPPRTAGERRRVLSLEARGCRARLCLSG